MANYSIVEYLGESNDGKCGYCKNTGNYNSCGFWAHTLQVEDYQALINRNWRRSGQYCYLPKNADTCCPMYTIKCDALNFKLNNSHKKILKRMKKFLRDGIKDKDTNPKHDSGVGESQEPKPAKEHSAVTIEGINVSALPQSESQVQSSKSPNKEEYKEVKKAVISESDKPSNPKKAKLIRIERKKQKLAAKGQTLDDVVLKKTRNQVKSLEEFLADEPKDGKHRLEVRTCHFQHSFQLNISFYLLQVKLIQSKNGSEATIFQLYKKYQMHVHNDPPEKLSTRSYERFLVNSPLQVKLRNPNLIFLSFFFFHCLTNKLQNLKTKLVSVSAAENSNINLSFNLFSKYELAVHKSTDSEFGDYLQFLVTSPLQVSLACLLAFAII